MFAHINVIAYLCKVKFKVHTVFARVLEILFGECWVAVTPHGQAL